MADAELRAFDFHFCSLYRTATKTMGAKTNSKAVAGRAAKEEVAQGKKNAAQGILDKAEDDDWAKGGKGKNSKLEDKAAVAAAALKRKQEAAKLLKEEEDAAPKFKAPSKPAPKKVVPVKAPQIPSFEDALSDPTEYSASGLDNALDLLSLVNEKTDKASVGQKAAKLEQHPERRFKAAFEAYKEAQLPIIRKERPGMRLQQYHDALYKDFQKSPDNPFNQVSIAYDSTKEEKVAALASINADREKQFRN